jgi:hypothetical protein
MGGDETRQRARVGVGENENVGLNVFEKKIFGAGDTAAGEGTKREFGPRMFDRGRECRRCAAVAADADVERNVIGQILATEAVQGPEEGVWVAAKGDDDGDSDHRIVGRLALQRYFAH